MNILAGDIGGTSTRLACYELREGRLVSKAEKTFPSKQFQGLETIAAAFAKAQNLSIDHACFGIAGPVQNGRVITPNLPWVVESSVVAKELGLDSVVLINDLEANAYGVAALKPEELVVLNPGVPKAVGNRAVISAGTGLGEAGLFWDGKVHRPFACEGGHCDFAPCTELESALLKYLKDKFGRVSYERVLSGPGLFNIYQFLRDIGLQKESPAVAAQMSQGDPSALISKTALAGTDPLCVQALDLFVNFYGAEAGNLALKIMSLGGVFIGGGIAPKILEKLKSPIFLNAFLGKGRMRPLLEAMPVCVITNENTALLGAALCAAQKAGELV